MPRMLVYATVLSSLCGLFRKVLPPVLLLQERLYNKNNLFCTFSVADVCKVLALDDFLHNVVGIHASVVHPGGVTLHRVLLPPENQWRMKIV